MSGKLTLISSATASGSSSVDFTSGIDTTYDEYVFYIVDINPATDTANFTFQVNATDGADYNDSAITSTYFRSMHSEADDAAELSYWEGGDLAESSAFQMLSYFTGNGADESSAGILHLFSPASTTYVKHFYSRVVQNRADDVGYEQYVAGYINDTTAIDEVRFKMSSGNFDGNIYLFGVS